MNRETMVNEALDRLPGMDRSDLLGKFLKLYDTPAPGKISRSLLELAVAYKIQEKAYGGLKPSIRKTMLTEIVPVKASNGTVLIREWHGEHHTVRVLDDGVIYRDTTYRSLSEVARLITGHRCSGPAFFGLKRKGRPS